MSSGFTLKLSVLRSSAGFEDAFIALRNALCSSSTSSNSPFCAQTCLDAEEDEEEAVDERYLLVSIRIPRDLWMELINPS